MHIRIINNTSLNENVNYKLIHNIHNILTSNNLDSTSTLVGNLNSNYVYDEDFDYFLNLYDNFRIIYNIDKIIKFDDDDVESHLLSYNIGTPEMNVVTYSSARNVNFNEKSFQGNTSIDYFDEFELFENVYMCTEMFKNCTNLKSIKYPSTISNGYINVSAHSGNTSLTNVEIINSIISKIGQGAFWGCTSLESITLPTTCTTLDSWAFNACSNLESINLQNVITLKSYAFQNCTSLNIDISNDLSNVESIEADAFINCTSLKGDLSLPSLTYIGGRGFGNCTGITSVSNLGSITTMEELGTGGTGYGPFINCTGLISVVLPSTLTLIKRNSFSGCTSLKTITGGNNVTRLLTGAFSNCTNLETVEFDFGKITELGGFTFNNCQKLNIETLSMPNLTGQLGAQTFGNCKKIKYVTDLGSITKMPASYNAGAYWGAFHDCTGLISVNLPSTCTVLDGRCFYDCTSLTTINLNNVTKIGEGCFMGCTSLSSVDLTNCTTIEPSAFYGCTLLTLSSLDFSNITKIGGAAFRGCTSLGLNQNLDWDVSNVESLGANTFRATGFKNVTLHSNKDMQIDNFSGSGQLGVFSDMANLLKFDLSDTKFTQFNMQASYYCSVLTTVILPKTLNNLPLFLGDLSGAMLYLIILSTNPPTVPTYDDYYTFRGVSSNFAMYVPDEAYESYRSADAWSTYPTSRIKRISELPSEVTWYTKEHPNDNYHVN